MAQAATTRRKSSPAATLRISRKSPDRPHREPWICSFSAALLRGSKHRALERRNEARLAAAGLEPLAAQLVRNMPGAMRAPAAQSSASSLQLAGYAAHSSSGEAGAPASAQLAPGPHISIGF